MNIDDFKGIFWLEYIHRLWGRIMGLSLVIPSFFFWAKGWLNFAIARHLVVIFIFGGLQGALGWWMVKSGLIDNPDVSQYRLTAHLLLAVTIHGYMFWLALTFFGLNGKILGTELIKFRSLYFLALSSCIGIFLMMLKILTCDLMVLKTFLKLQSDLVLVFDMTLIFLFSDLTQVLKPTIQRSKKEIDGGMNLISRMLFLISV